MAPLPTPEPPEESRPPDADGRPEGAGASPGSPAPGSPDPGGPVAGPEEAPPGATEALDDGTVAARWAEITAALGSLGGPDARPAGPRDYVADEEEDEGFVPPDPGPLTDSDPVVTLGWTAVVGSVVVALLVAVLWQPVPGGLMAVLGLVLVGGAGLLLWRLPDERDDHAGGGGAVV